MSPAWACQIRRRWWRISPRHDVTDKPAPPPKAEDERLAREAAALRENLKRRKEQARKREGKEKEEKKDVLF